LPQGIIIVIPIIGPILGLVKTGVESFAAHKKAKMENSALVERKKLERLEKLDANTEEWNRIMAQGANVSWKDEYWTIVLSIPALLAFIPGMDVHVLAGFEVLGKMPEWYRYALLTAIAAAFGFRQMTNLKLR